MPIKDTEIVSEKIRQLAFEHLLLIGGKAKRDEIVILCPFHDDTNPSLNVHVGHKVMPGAYHCWSCGAHGGWNSLARKLGLPTVDYERDAAVNETDNIFALLGAKHMSSEFVRDDSPPVVNGLEPLPPGFVWRDLPRKFYEGYGAKYLWQYKNGEDMQWLYFPLTTNWEYRGYTICALKPNKLKYLTMADTKKVLFLYDQTPSNIPVVLVEGHMDALRLQYYGIPAMAIFGTENWSPFKKALLAAKSPKKVYIMMDGDEAGYRAAQNLYVDLVDGFDVDVLYLPNDNGKMDPGNMPDNYIISLQQLVKQ